MSVRFILPLFIPKYPIPAILLCLLMDAADMAVLQTFTGMDMAGYQSYDKALDIFYLSIAMLTTLRNWKNFEAVVIARILFYIRLGGVLIFELTGYRLFLVLFPNVFEYFFILYEGIRLYWIPNHFKRRSLLKAVLIIWVLIKFPQEYWLHMARLDVTDLIRDRVINSPMNRVLGEGLSHLIAFAATVVVIVAFFMILRRIAGPREHPLTLSSEPLPVDIDEARERARHILNDWKIFDLHLVEKVLLVGFISVIFSQMLPGMNIRSIHLFAGLAVFVLFNTFLRFQYSRGGRKVESAVLSFIILGLINGVLAFFAQSLIKRGFLNLPGTRLLFFLLLMTLIVTLYDRWRPVFEVRFAHRTAEADTQ
ncbi:MAG: hypothetical protein R6U43_11620 [Candidatus Krumholzibacteriales bacterium]